MFKALLICSLVALGSATLDYTRVHLVDHDAATGNLLFRGNMPTNSSHVFIIDTLLSYLKKRAKEASVPFPAAGEFLLYDISLNNDFDGKDFKGERDFWKDPSTKSLGQFINWPLGLAGIVPPKLFPKSKIPTMANGSVWKLDQIPSRVQQIRNWLTTPLTTPNKKVVVQYVHCTAGCDRTGEVIGSYRMRYNNNDVIDMYSKDVAECGRPPNYWSTTALEWFCEYITNNPTFGLGPKVGDCEGFATCKFAGHCTPTHNTTITKQVEITSEPEQLHPCNDDNDCAGLCTYCQNGAGKTPPYNCHAPTNGCCLDDADCDGSYCMNGPGHAQPWKCHGSVRNPLYAVKQK